MEDAMEVYKELFNLPIEEKKKYVINSTNSIRTGLYSGDEDPNGKNHLWRDTLVHHCHPLEQYIDSWPEKPSQYRYDSIISLHMFFVNKFLFYNQHFSILHK